MYHKRLTVNTDTGPIEVTLDIVPDEYEPYALLGAKDQWGESLAEVRVGPTFIFNVGSASAWIESGFLKPGR
jgi:hypothetical protein